MYNQYDIVLKFVRLYEYTQAAVSNRSRDRKVCETITAIGSFPFCKNPLRGLWLAVCGTGQSFGST